MTLMVSHCWCMFSRAGACVRVAQVEYRQEQKRLRDMAASHAASFLNGVRGNRCPTQLGASRFRIWLTAASRFRSSATSVRASARTGRLSSTFGSADAKIEQRFAVGLGRGSSGSSVPV